jgi:hypothetical protein
MLWSGEWVRRLKPGAASSEAESWSRGRQALERGGVSPEGASSSRARRSFTRGGVRPSSEAEFTRRGARSSSEAETHPRGTTVDRLVGRCGLFGSWAFPLLGRDHSGRAFGVRGVFLCFTIFRKRGFSPVIRGPLWLSPTVAPEPLRWYLLGTCRG